MTTGTFSTTLDESEGVLVVVGDVDEGVVDEFQQTIRAASDGFAKPLTIDLSDVAFLPSAALSVLVASMQQATAAGQDVELLARNGTIAQRVLQVVALPHRTS